MKYVIFFLITTVCIFVSAQNNSSRPAGDGGIISDIRLKRLQSSENEIVTSIPHEATEGQKAEAFAKIARLYRYETNTTAVAKKSNYAQKALQCQNLPTLIRCDMHLLFAEALNRQSKQLPSAVKELTERQLISYLEGLALTLDHLKVTERVPLRGVERFDVPPGSSMRAKAEKRHAEQMAYAEYAEEQNELLTYRDSFLQSIFVLCDPSAFERYDFNKKLLEMGCSEEKARAVCEVLRSAAQKEVESKRVWTAAPHNISPTPTNSVFLKQNDVPCFAEQDLESRGLAYEQKIRTLLAEARTNDNYKVMDQNHQLFRQMNILNVKEYIESDFPKYLEAHPDRILALRLDILQFLYEMRDWSYDVKNPPRYKITPPLTPGRNWFPGTPPEEIADPAVRERYVKELALKDKIEKKHLREHTLQDKYESRLRFIHMILKSSKEDAARKGNQEKLKAFEEILKKQITNTVLLDIIYGRPKPPQATTNAVPTPKSK